MYELFDHTADLGVRIRAPDVDTLFAEAGRALAALLVENVEDVRLREAVRIDLRGDDRAYLLFDWLNELLYSFEGPRLLLAAFDVRVAEDGLTAEARGEPYDPGRHRLDREVKAITYHGLMVEPDDDGWIAEVIVDI